MKVLIKEEQQNRLKLAPFIYKAISTKRTSLGDNPAFPPYGDFGFEYDVVKKKYEEVNETIDYMVNGGFLESKDPDYLLSVLSKKFDECKRLEEPIRPQLQKLCENIINSAFSIPSETVIIKCRLVGKIKPKKGMRILPEGDDEKNTYDFEDVDEAILTNKVILKRRFINSLIQGISYWLSTDLDDWHDSVAELNDKIWGLWHDIKNITDYLLFVKEEKISEKNPMQMSYVEVTLGKKGRKTIIDAQGLIFPYLLRETFRGFLELFSSHGLPEDNQKAMYIIRKADFLVAEPWDLRLGMGIMDMLHDNLTKKYKTSLLFKPNRIPYFFTELCELQTDEFNDVMQNFLLGTKKGNVIAREMDSRIAHDDEYQKFKDRIQKKNVQKSLISDGDFSKEELNDYVIQENETDEMIGYHGSNADFNKFNHKKYLNTGAGSQVFGWGTYITDDKSVALGYTNGSYAPDYLEEYSDWIKQGYTIEDIKKGKEHIFKNMFFKNHIDEFINKGLDEYEAKLSCSILWDFLRTEDFLKNRTIAVLKNWINKKKYELDMFGVKMPSARVEKNLIRYKTALEVLNGFKIEDIDRGTLYEVEIPDEDGFNYLLWDEPITEMQLEAIYAEMEAIDMKHNSNIFDGFLDDEDFLYNADGETVYLSLVKCFESHLESTNSRANAYKAASLFLLQCGFDGIMYPAGTIWGKPFGASDDAYNYVIFDANKVKIVNKTRM